MHYEFIKNKECQRDVMLFISLVEARYGIVRVCERERERENIICTVYMYVFVSAIGLILFKSTSEMFKRCIILKM